MDRIKKNLERVDKFGENYTFKYKDKDKYSTIFGGILFLIIFATGITISIINLIPFAKRENISLQYYTVKVHFMRKIKNHLITLKRKTFKYYL